jgi:hypothetical protein
MRCGPLRSFPKEFNHPPALLGQGTISVPMQGSTRARPLGVSEVESAGEATVEPSCSIHLSVQKHFTLAATQAAESCFPGVERRPFALGCELADSLRLGVGR